MSDIGRRMDQSSLAHEILSVGEIIASIGRGFSPEYRSQLWQQRESSQGQQFHPVYNIGSSHICGQMDRYGL